MVLAGDFVAGGVGELAEVLGLFAEFTGPKIMVAGNHDLWIGGPPFETWTRYEGAIADAAAEQGFHYVDGGPLIVDDVAFVGGMGWYDYSSRQSAEPVADVRVTPVGVSYKADAVASFRAVPDRGEMSWDQLQASDYAHKGMVWQVAGGTHAAVWNDGIYIDWGRSDEEMTEYFVEKIRSQIAEVAGKANRVVGVTHFVPFAEFAEDDSHEVKRAMARAYLGSARMGEALREAENLRVAIFGHRHRQEVREVDGIVAADASIARDEERPLLLTLPD